MWHARSIANVWKARAMKTLRIRRRRVFLARMIAVAALSVAAIGVGTGTASAREMTKHPAKVTVPDLKVSVTFVDLAEDLGVYRNCVMAIR